RQSLTSRCLAEALGTFILVFFGCGVVHAAVLTNAQHGLWQVATVWGVAVTVAIYVVGVVSGAYINPAITIAMAAWRRLPWGDVVLGTLLLALVGFALTDDRNAAAPLARLAPAFIGLTIAVLISVIGPLTQACFKPARDFGPRLVACFAGWGRIALPGPRGL